MINTGLVYLVMPKWEDSICGAYGCFDTLDKAFDFVNRFKTVPDHEIMEIELNPDYYSYRQMDPYYVRIGKNDADPIHNYIADMIDEVEDANTENFQITFHGNSGVEGGQFGMYLFAPSKKAALEKVIAVRNAVIAQGEWLAAWERYNSETIQLSPIARY